MKLVTVIKSSTTGELITSFEGVLYETELDKMISLKIPQIEIKHYELLVVDILMDEIDLFKRTVTRTISVFSKDI